MRYKWFRRDKRWTYSITKRNAVEFKKWWKRFKKIHGAPGLYEPRQRGGFYEKWKPTEVNLE